MIFIINEKGKVISQDVEPVYQGSKNTSKIVVVSPLVNSSVTIVFDLPNGDRSRTYLLNLQGREIDYQEQSCCVWLYSLPSEITRYAGQVKAQFCFYNGTATVENNQLKVNGSLITTSTIGFVVQNGVVAVDEVENNEEENIIEDLKSQILIATANEQEREQAEINRMEDEQQRIEAETLRQENEEERLRAEEERLEKELERNQAEEERKQNNDRNMIETISFHSNDDCLFAKKEYKNMQTGEEGEIDEIIPLANEQNAGAMSPSDFIQIKENTARIAQLEGKPRRLIYTEKQNPTASEINSFVLEQGYNLPFTGISVVVDQTFNVWHYYTNLGLWKDNGKDTMQQFSNDKIGAIKGSNVAGKIFAENDGTGSVVGWDELNQKVDTNLNKVVLNGEELLIKNNQVNITTPKLKILI